jgi:hypothetical protein
MTNGEIQKLQDLSKCYLYCGARRWVDSELWESRYEDARLSKWSKAYLRRLTHQYRNQIAACKRNQQRANA